MLATNRPEKTLPARAAGLILVILMTTVTSACSAQPTPTAAQPTAAPPTPTASRAPATPPSGLYAAALAAAVKEAAARLNIPESALSLVRAEPVEWPDTSLGCPKPGMAYAQVITPGFRLVLGAGQATYEYHSDLAGRIVACF